MSFDSIKLFWYVVWGRVVFWNQEAVPNSASHIFRHESRDYKSIVFEEGPFLPNQYISHSHSCTLNPFHTHLRTGIVFPKNLNTKYTRLWSISLYKLQKSSARLQSSEVRVQNVNVKCWISVAFIIYLYYKHICLQWVGHGPYKFPWSFSAPQYQRPHMTRICTVLTIQKPHAGVELYSPHR